MSQDDQDDNAAEKQSGYQRAGQANSAVYHPAQAQWRRCSNKATLELGVSQAPRDGERWAKIWMTELDEKILALKRGGVSLRRIGTALGISHIAVLKRLKGLEASGKVLTEKRVGVSPEQTEGKENMSPGSKPHRSRHSEGPQGSGNRVVTPKVPSPISDNGVTPVGRPTEALTEA